MMMKTRTNTCANAIKYPDKDNPPCTNLRIKHIQYTTQQNLKYTTQGSNRIQVFCRCGGEWVVHIAILDLKKYYLVPKKSFSAKASKLA